MPGYTFNTTPNGWPLVDLDNYLVALPQWSADLANMLDTSDASAPAAINAANDAAASAAAAAASAAAIGYVFHVQTVTVAITTAATFKQQAISWPAGLFGGAPNVFAAITGAGGNVMATARGWATSATAGQVQVGLPSSTTSTQNVVVLAMRAQ